MGTERSLQLHFFNGAIRVQNVDQSLAVTLLLVVFFVHETHSVDGHENVILTK
jgi:hypothetical protein